MNKLISLTSLAALTIATPALAQDTEKAENPSPNAIVDAAQASDWVKIAPSDLLVMDLAPDAEGPSTSSGLRRVVIQLMPEPFSQGWIRNIRKLAAAHWWDGTSINRVQDNYVVQWGDAGYDNPESGETEQKALPEGLETVPESEYSVSDNDISKPREFIQANVHSTKLIPLSRNGIDAYAQTTMSYKGWAIARYHDGTNAPVHCYGAVGVGRNLSPDTGSGAELYTVIGHAPRHLDRNIAVVGRVIEGIEHLSSLPRGKGQLGFYADASKRVPITSIRLASELPVTDQPRFEYLDTEGETFAKYADARANRRDPFFIKPAGGADICNIPVPVRRVSGE
ncbi:peptidylprolyl isomerase [Parasphingorhabdus sp.]|uniref:peptidylprolyl isomerase n=1 Tax=Parasphingorhabdus sp. TaxID=2709688 RepID=UPI003A8FD2FC